MKHDALIAPDESQFAFTPKMSGFADAVANDGASDFVTVPDAHLLFSGEFKHSGNDLKIIGDDGTSFLVTDYFKTDKHPTLRSPDGATLDGNLVGLLAGPLAPGQYAQAGAPQPGAAEVVGHVAVVTGNVSVIRNGVAITVNAGDAILKNDVLQTGAGATMGVAFNDGSTFNLSANARLAVNEFVYDPQGSSNASAITLIQGAATFVAGQIAKTGDMKVGTPVATMGIRGTAVILDINALDGRVSISVVDQRDNLQHNVEVFDRAGNLIATATSIGGKLFLTPTATADVIASFTNKTPDLVAQEFAAFQAVLSSYEAAKQFFPNLPDHTDLNPKNTQHAEGTTIQPSDSGSKTLPDPVKFGDKIVVVEVDVKKLGDTSNTDTDTTKDTDDTKDVTSDTHDGPTITYIFGTAGDDDGHDGSHLILVGTAGPDHVEAGPGDDIVEGGDGRGNDFYDGGTGYDQLIYPSATTGLIFHLYGISAPNNTADDAPGGSHIDHDVFTNFEAIESGSGDDVFELYANDEWHLDGGCGVDILRFAAEFNILEGSGIEARNVEIIDLDEARFAITIQLDAQGVFQINDDHTVRVLGGASDTVTLANDFFIDNQPVDGRWELVSECPVLDPFYEDDYSNGIYFYEYQFVAGCEVLATAYLQQEIQYNSPPEIFWSPEAAVTPVDTPLSVAGMQFDDATTAAGELFTFTVKVHHGTIDLAFNPQDFNLEQVSIEGDNNDANTHLPYQYSFTGTLADINAALEACDGDTGFIYTPESNYSGPSDLTFTVTDSHGATDRETLAISVGGPANQAPQIAISDPDPSPLVEDDSVTSAQASVSVSDPDSDVGYVLSEGWAPVAPDLEDAQEYNGHYYAFVAFDQGTVSWDLAQRNAQAMGGDLAAITSAGENDFIFQTVVGDNIEEGITAYLGGSDANSPGLWYWSSGLEGIPYFWSNEAGASSYGQYTNWREGEPNNVNGFEHYVVMEGNGQWNDGMSPYSLAVGYVVEFSNYFMQGTYGYAIFNTANGTITYHLNNEDAQKLGADDHVTDDFQIAVTDGLSTVMQTVSFAVDGANDDPTLETASTDGGSIYAPAGTPGEPIVMENNFAFSDVDVNDTHTVSFQLNTELSTGESPLGTFSVPAEQFNDTTNGRGGLVHWEYSVDADAVNALAPGTQLIQVYDVTVDDGHGGTATHQVTITINGQGEVVGGGNEAPVISVESASTSENGGYTTLSGLSVTDVDANESETFHVTAVAEHGGIAVVDPETNDDDTSAGGVSFDAAFGIINGILSQGFVYTQPESQDDPNDKVTLTITDQNGASDTLNFVFNNFGTDPIALTGTEGKDVIFATGYTDTLIGDINGAHSTDIFVFDHYVGPGIGNDVITDFTLGQDKIALLHFGVTDVSQLTFMDEAGRAQIAFAETNETIELQGVTLAQAQVLTNDSFIFHP